MLSDLTTSVKAYWDRQPCNLLRSSAPVGSLAWSEDLFFNKYYAENHILGFAEFERWKGKKVLEVGCGLGTDTINFAAAGAQVTAVDLSEESLRLAKSRSLLYRLKGSILFKYADVEELNRFVFTHTFDLVYCFGVLHHTQNPGRALDQLRNYCGPETKVKIMVYNKWSWKAIGIFLRHGPGVVSRYSEAQQGCPVTYTYSKKGITRLLTEHGFKVTSIKIDHIFPYSIPEYKQQQYKRVWWFRYLPAKVFRWLEGKLGWHLLIEATCQ